MTMSAKHSLLAVAVVLALSVVLAAGCRQPAPPPTQTTVTPTPSPAPPPPSDAGEGVGQKAPDFTVKDIDGKTHSLNDYGGRILIVDFWATYCKPCVKALLEYARNELYAGPDVQILALSMDDSDEVIRGWQKQNTDVRYPLARLDDATRKAFFGDAAIVPIPQVRLIDGKGIIRYSFGPDATHEQVAQAVRTLLAEKQ